MIINLNQEIERLIAIGITDFISSGEPGFDQIAAALIIAKKEMGQNVRLIFALSCKGEDEPDSDAQTQLTQNVLAEADEIVVPAGSGIEQRDRYMIERSAHCICALVAVHSRTGQVVRDAMQEGLAVYHTVCR